MGNVGNAIAVAALVVSVCVATFGYMRAPPLVPANRLRALEAEIIRLNARIAEADRDVARLVAEVAFLKSRVQTLMSEVEYWQDEARRRSQKP